MIKFTIITLFREALEPYLKTSMMWKATEKGLAEFDFVNLRDFGLGPHKSVDDTPYGGGDGMLLRCEPVFNAIGRGDLESRDGKENGRSPVRTCSFGHFYGQAFYHPVSTLRGVR